MENGSLPGRLVLGALGVTALTLLWGKVRAANGPVAAPAARVFAVADAPASNEAGKGFGLSRAFSAAASHAAAGMSGGSGMAPEAAPAVAPAPRSVLPKGFPRRIVRNGSAVFEVKDYEKARRLAFGIALKHGAEVARDEGTEREGCRAGVMAFRVAPEKLDALLRDLEPLGRVLSRSMSMQNMTEEYVDLGSRVAAALKVEARLQRLLDVNTSNLEHVLEVERELQRVGTEIETLLGRMKYIDGLAAESTLTVSLAEPGRVVEARTHGVLSRVLDSFSRTFNTFVSTGVTLLDMTGFLLAVGLWAAPLALLLRWAWRKWG